jgi:hypothetical protein
MFLKFTPILYTAVFIRPSEYSSVFKTKLYSPKTTHILDKFDLIYGYFLSPSPKKQYLFKKGYNRKSALYRGVGRNLSIGSADKNNEPSFPDF